MVWRGGSAISGRRAQGGLQVQVQEGLGSDSPPSWGGRRSWLRLTLSLSVSNVRRLSWRKALPFLSRETIRVYRRRPHDIGASSTSRSSLFCSRDGTPFR